jgi:putative ABC transport system permease protein
MLINYLKIAFRNLLRQKMFSFINIFGLALSMSVCLLVLLHIKDQVGYDKFHPQSDRIYRITTKVTNREGNSFKLATTPLPLANTLSNDYDLLDQAVRIYPAGSKLVSAAGKKLTVHSAFTDPAFFHVFGFTLQSGSAGNALTEPNSIVLSKTTAERFFGNSPAAGQILSFAELGDFRVTGIMEKPAGKSHIDFDAYISMSSVSQLEKNGKLAANLNSWNDGTVGYTYVLLNKKARDLQLNNAVKAVSSELMKQSKVSGKEKFEFTLQPFNKIILGEEMHYSLGKTGSIGKIWAEVAIGLIILISACFNYTNLSIARSLKRGKEVGIRKVNGASRVQVFIQFIVESVLIAMLSLVLACILLKALWTDAPFSSDFISPDTSIDGMLLLWFFLFSLFTGLLAGVLPAWALSSFKPVEVLKNLSNIKLFGGNRFGKGLIVAQFALSLFITIFTIIFYKQFDYMARLDPGYARDHIISIPLNGNSYDLVSHDISQVNGVVTVSASSNNPGKEVTGVTNVSTGPGVQPFGMDYYFTDRNFISNMKLKLLAGTNFPPSGAVAGERFVIINEQALAQLKLSSPAEAIGKAVWLHDTMQLQVAGVIKDFYHRGVDMWPRPLLLRYHPQELRIMQVRTTANQPSTLIPQMERIWKKYNPGENFNPTLWKDDLFKGQGAMDTVGMLAFLAFMAITIACLGLLGIVIYSTQTRRKEIGIRKVLGATVQSVMILLSKNFLKLVLIAGCIAIPLSYLAAYFFLNIFANRISPGIGIMLSGFAGILALAIATIGAQVYKVAVANPVDSLRTE